MGIKKESPYLESDSEMIVVSLITPHIRGSYRYINTLEKLFQTKGLDLIALLESQGDNFPPRVSPVKNYTLSTSEKFP